MFRSAHVKLTAWYLLIIMLISTMFSIAFYNASTGEIQHLIHRIQERQLQESTDFSPPTLQRFFGPNVEELQEAETRLKLILVLINAGILLIAGGAGYFLAKKTLQPIQVMVDEQNRFITDASHELRTPLTALRSEIEVGLREKTLTKEDAKEILASNLEEVISLQTLSDSLLELTQSRVANRQWATVKVAILFERAKKQLTTLAKKRNITIETKVGSEMLYGDEMSLYQSVIILLDNAIKYGPADSVVTLKSRKTDHSIVIEIHDAGGTIDEKDIPFLFDRFYRGDKSRSKSVDGYGLGLSIAKKIIDEHNGSIKVTSNKNTGTTFAIRFPARSR